MEMYPQTGIVIFCCNGANDPGCLFPVVTRLLKKCHDNTCMNQEKRIGERCLEVFFIEIRWMISLSYHCRFMKCLLIKVI